MGTAKTSGVLMASVPVLRPAAARGQVCGGSVSSVLRTVAASPEQSTSLAMVPGTELGTLLVTWPHHCPC